MDFDEYNLRMRAYELKRLEETEMLYVGANVNRIAKATNKKGEYRTKNLLKSLKKEKLYKEIVYYENDRSKKNRLYRTALRAKEYRERRDNGEL